MAEGEQEVYVRSARTKVGASGRAKEKEGRLWAREIGRAARTPAFIRVRKCA